MQFQWSSYGVELRDMIDKWQSYYEVLQENEDRANRVKLLIDGQNFIFFFHHNGKFFGGPENSRLAFATMKNPDDDCQSIEDLSFSATNLLNALSGNPTEHIFFTKDIDDIDVINKADLFDFLMKGSKGNKEDKSKNHELVSKMGHHRKFHKDKEKNNPDGASISLQGDVN